MSVPADDMSAPELGRRSSAIHVHTHSPVIPSDTAGNRTSSAHNSEHSCSQH